MMSISKLEQYLQEINAKLFSFGFAMVSNEEMAQKMVINTINIFFVDRPELVREFKADPSLEVRNKIKLYLFGKLLELARKKSAGGKIKSNGEQVAYKNLSVDKKAVLYLKHKTNFNYDELEQITNQFRHEIISHLYNAREELLSELGIEFSRGQ